jgi:hypothetical protein
MVVPLFWHRIYEAGLSYPLVTPPNQGTTHDIFRRIALAHLKCIP